MKLFKIVLLLLVFIPCLAFGNNNDTLPKQDELKYSSINIKFGLNLGNEIGPTFKVEYENRNWGKIILHSEIAVYMKSTLLTDIGIGYGYPVLRSKSSALYFNSHITWTELGLDVLQYEGPSAMFELEFRKKWLNLTFLAAPFFRQQLLYDVEEYSYNHNLSHNLLEYTFGINLGFSCSFSLKKHNAN